MYVTPEQIFNATDGGLMVILEIYPQAADCVTNPRKKFRVRATDKTASASLKKVQEGVWVVTDFGGDQKPRNCIELTRIDKNLEYKDAITWLANKYNIIPMEDQKQVIKADFSKRPATDEEKEGDTLFDIKKNFTEAELKVLFADKVIEYYKFQHKENWIEKLEAVCAELNFSSLITFTHIKNREAIVLGSNDNYPIFLIEGEGFKKIYQPLNPDKAFRFRYTGTKPKSYIFGYKQLTKKYNDGLKKWEDEAEDKKNQPGEADEKKKSKKAYQLPEIVIGSGERDSLNIRAMGYPVIWQNSETAHLESTIVTQLRKMCENIYNVPDIDATGLRAGHELAMKYLDIKTAWLPEELRQHKDARGNPSKDLRDYLRFNTVSKFKNLIKTAMPYQFWENEPQFTRDGQFKKMGYQPNNIRLYNFLMRNGFFRFENLNEKEGYSYIQIINNTVYPIKSHKVKEYVNDFLKHYYNNQSGSSIKVDEQLLNTFFRTTQLNETSLANLPYTSIDFTDYDKHTQYMFFINKTWEITKEGVKQHVPADVLKRVWDDEVIKHRVDLLPPPFVVSQTALPDGGFDYDIKINNTECLFLRYLINASRINWRKEYETSWAVNQEEERLKYIEENKFNLEGPRLTKVEQAEQKKHLINKLFALGYLLHRYKDPSRPWCVFAMDARPSDDGESHGGSGKSIAFKSIRYFMNSVTLDGRNKNLTKNPHIYEMVSEHTDYIFIDDADQWLDFDYFFSPLTGDLPVNPKNNKQFTIPFEKVPKFCITSNYTLRKTDASTSRRILYTVFADYYHYNANNDYKETRSPKDEFGKNLFLDFTEAEWNLFFNTMASACSFYMNVDKIEPPMNNVERRNLMTAMGPHFQDWADVYFSPEAGNLNTLVERDVAFENYIESSNIQKMTPQRFKKSLIAWCRYYNYELNPVELLNAEGRIIRKVSMLDKFKNPILGKTKSAEMLYISTGEPVKEGTVAGTEVKTDFTMPPGNKIIPDSDTDADNFNF